MPNLHAPWRIDFIRQEKAPGPESEGCFFCRYLGDPPARDRENLVLHRGRGAFVLMNRYPYTGGHLMVALTRHEGRFEALTAEEFAETTALAQRAVEILRRDMRAEGFNVGWNLGRCAGAGVVDHLHLHLVPRWSGDTNFMPVLAGVTVLPEALAELYDRLKPLFGV